MRRTIMAIDAIHSALLASHHQLGTRRPVSVEVFSDVALPVFDPHPGNYLPVIIGSDKSDFVGKVQDRLGTPIVLFKFIDCGSGEESGELHNVSERRPAERIDGLRVVPHDHYVVVPRSQSPDQIRLEAIRILIFIHQDIAVVL